MADELTWDRFAVVGISGGGRHPLACPAGLPERVAVVGIVSGVAPFWPDALEGMLATTRRGFRLARWAPWLLVLASRRTSRHPDRFLARLRGELPDCDQRVVARPEVAEAMAENAAQALAGDEMTREMLLQREWGFAPSDVAVPTLLWHGDSDRNVPVAQGRRVAAAMPDCRLTFLRDAGHFLIFDHWPAVLSGVAAEW